MQTIRSNNQNASNGVPSVPTDSPVWETGKPASFDESSLNAITQGLDAALKDLGYFFARTQVKIVPDRTNGTADLVITVLDEGSSGVIDQINITGLKRNQRAAVLKYLALKPGLPVNRQLLLRTENLLWRSARFLDFKVTPEVVPDRKRINLKIALTESEPMPPLQQDLSREAKALLRFRDWLSDQQAPDRDIVVTVGTTEKPLPWPGLRKVQVILSQRGLLVTAGEDAENAPARYAAAMAQGIAGLFDLAHHAKLAGAFTNRPVELGALLTILPDPEPGRQHTLLHDYCRVDQGW